MKKIVVLLISILFANGAFAQITLQSITKDCIASFNPNDKEFKFRNENGKLVTRSTDEIAALLRKDVIGYFDLSDKYDTPLKTSAFKKSEEYATLVSRINKECDSIMQNKSYMLYSLYNNSPYDMAKHCFNFKIDFDNLAKCSTPGYFSFGGGLALTFPTSYMTYKKIATNENIYGYKNYNILKTPTISEETALRIEENMNNVSILIVFKTVKSVMEDKPVIGVSGYVMEMPFILGKTIGVYLVNERTGEVYVDMSNILTQPAVRRTTTQRKR